MSATLLNRILLTTLSRIKFSRLNIVSSSFKRLTPQYANQIPYQPIISKYSTSTSLVHNAEDQKQCLDLYKELKTYDVDQIMNLMTADRKHDLDPTHLAICMKRLYALYEEGDFELQRNITEDPRLKKLSCQLVISARYLSPPVIVDMIKSSHSLRCPDSHLYALLKLCTNVVGDLTAYNIADLTETMVTIIDDLEAYRRCDYIESKMNHKTPEELKSLIEWKLMLTNQIEVMMKCLLLLAESKDHQFRILTVKSRVDLLLAFGNNLPSVNSLLYLMLKDFNDFLGHPEELIRAISALLICLSSYPTLSPPSISPTPQMFPSFMNLKFSRFKDVLLSNNDDVKDRLLKDIKVDDEYDKLCEGFEKTLLRTNKDKSMESQKAEHEKRIFFLTTLLDKTLEAFHRLEKTFKIKTDNWEMLLTACTEFLGSNPSIRLDHLISQCLDLIVMASNEKLESGRNLETLYKFANMRYFPEQLITAFKDDRSNCEESSVHPNYHDVDLYEVHQYAIDEILVMLECFMAYGIISDPHYFCSGIEKFLDELEKEKYLSKHDLDFKMKFASYMIMNNREIQTVESIFFELQSNLHQYESDESKINNALIFLTCVENSKEHSSYHPLINGLKYKLRPNNEFVDNMINKLWPGRVKKSPSAFNGYIIDFPSSDTNAEHSKKVHLTFHYDDAFWRNNGQLRPLWYLAEKTLQCQGHHVVPINVTKLVQMPDGEEYLKYRVEHSEEFGDISNIV